MFAKTVLSLAAAVAVFTAQAQGFVAPKVDIASSPYYACNCPNNCNYGEGHSCKYFGGASSSNTVGGACAYVGGTLTCV
ncbi:hypothetical protein VSDG_07575 [Cytospora chrysosperma]|uniref:Uncharacterized protein n=1 Tax=Cytospora chrysosperma TaxID=252740 RepID=A0A423VM88_CYTCH|nr:hypothetical protein VSDG_07575 [Valsa sordida]